MYENFEPKYPGPEHELSRSEAKESFAWFMSQKDTRIAALKQLTGTSGLESLSRDTLPELHEWFVTKVSAEPRQDDGGISAFTRSLCNDIGMFMGDLLIESTAGITWELCTEAKGHFSYHRPHLIGFIKGYSDVDYNLLLVQYAHRLSAGREVEADLFSVLFNSSYGRAKPKTQ